MILALAEFVTVPVVVRSRVIENDGVSSKTTFSDDNSA